MTRILSAVETRLSIHLIYYHRILIMLYSQSNGDVLLDKMSRIENILDISFTPSSTCSPSSLPSNESSASHLVPLLAGLSYSCMLFTVTMACTINSAAQ